MANHPPQSIPPLTLGQELVRRGVISPAQLEDALRLKARRGGRLGSHLVALGYVDQAEIDRIWVEQHVVPQVEAALDRASGNRFTAEQDRRLRFNEASRREILVEDMLDGSASAKLTTEIVGECIIELAGLTSLAIRFVIDASTGFCELEAEGETIARRWIPSVLGGRGRAVAQPDLPEDFEAKLKRLMAG